MRTPRPHAPDPSPAQRLQSLSTPPPLRRRWTRVWTTVGCHGVIDFLSYLIVPLMPLLVTRLELTDAQRAWVLGVGSVASGLVQPLVAWISDRLNTRWLGTMGLVLAATSLGLLGHATSFTQLLIIQLISSLGIGAFHPVAAAAVGQLAASRRAMGVTIFFIGGMAGGISGNLFATPYVRALGPEAFIHLILPGLLCAAALAWAIHRVPSGAHAVAHDPQPIPKTESRARWASIWILYLGNVIRFTVNSAMVYLVIDWTIRLTAQRQGADWATIDDAARKAFGIQASEINGWLQASMQLGMGAAAITMGRAAARTREKSLIIWMPALGSIPIFLVPWAQSAMEPTSPHLTVPAVFILCTIAGVGFGGIVPLTIALAQRLLPHRTTLASGLMMGGAWFMAFLGPILGKELTNRLGPDGAWHAIAILLLAAAALSFALPSALLRRL